MSRTGSQREVSLCHGMACDCCGADSPVRCSSATEQTCSARWISAQDACCTLTQICLARHTTSYSFHHQPPRPKNWKSASLQSHLMRR